MLRFGVGLLTVVAVSRARHAKLVTGCFVGCKRDPLDTLLFWLIICGGRQHNSMNVVHPTITSLVVLV